MTKLYYDYQKVNNNLLPQLYEAKKSLNVVLNRINSLNIPYSFDYRNYLLGLSNKIENYIKKLKSMEDRIEYSNKEIVRAMDDFNYNISQIEKTDIKIRENIVR